MAQAAAADALGERFPFAAPFHRAQQSCEFAARRVRLAIEQADQEIASVEEQSRSSNEDRNDPQEVRRQAEDHTEYLRGVLEGYSDIRKVLLLKKGAIEIACDDPEQLPPTARADLEKMAELFDVMQVHMYRLLAVPYGWFSIQVERWKSWARENPLKAAGVVCLGGAFLGGVFGILTEVSI